MKKKLNLKINELISLRKITNKLYDLNFSLLEKEEKVAVSIGLILADKFDKKYKTIQKKLDLFEAKKPIKFTLDFYEAWALKKLCIELYGIGDTDFEKLGIQNVINKLDRDGC
ncbi:hypothetical protein PG911_08735 [Tenacibaculum ovolyticum]|uniref:hypothetical protein n=1 Tax=Tenacibaculum ovolyticum TaxID=104270 RepID=UPI0022F405DB|nr:hypothetical protein [Tenacibaculum ovolyticum]WBX78331.1 hypothetical protein PG911_08735 [Tenacibaculum ovolyticum]